MDISNFPQFVPIGDYRVDVQIFTYINGEEEFILLAQEFFEVKPIGAMQF